MKNEITIEQCTKAIKLAEQRIVQARNQMDQAINEATQQFERSHAICIKSIARNENIIHELPES